VHFAASILLPISCCSSSDSSISATGRDSLFWREADSMLIAFLESSGENLGDSLVYAYPILCGSET
jgi:hypothetical protein